MVSNRVNFSLSYKNSNIVPRAFLYECPLLVNSSLDEMEKNHVSRVLNSTSWHKGEACRILGISRPRLRRIIKQHGLIDPNDSDFEEVDFDEIATIIR